MEKTIETANESLLKKRKESQKEKTVTGKEYLQKLQSKINDEGLESARSEALLKIHRVDRDTQKEIIELFKVAETATFECVQCKRDTTHRFNLVFLQYDREQTTCDDCMQKINGVIAERKLQEKMKALEVFEQKQEAWLDIFVKECNVPEIFIDAKETDMPKEIADTLKSSQSYYITGDVGVGKTHLAVALIRKYISYIKPYYDDQRKEYLYDVKIMDMPIFIEVPELLLRIRDTYNDDAEETEKDIIDHYTKTPLLVLDDLGTEKASDFSTLMLYLIINRRCSNELTTIITSNLTLDEINDRLSERISSRIKGMCKMIGMTGQDRRFNNTD